MSTRQLFTRDDAGVRRSGPVVMVRQFAPDSAGQAAGSVRLRAYADHRYGLEHEAPADVAAWCGTGVPLAPVAALAVTYHEGAYVPYAAPIKRAKGADAPRFERCAVHGMVKATASTTAGVWLCPHGCGAIAWPQATGDVECAGHIAPVALYRGSTNGRCRGRVAPSGDALVAHAAEGVRKAHAAVETYLSALVSAMTDAAVGECDAPCEAWFVTEHSQVCYAGNPAVPSVTTSYTITRTVRRVSSRESAKELSALCNAVSRAEARLTASRVFTPDAAPYPAAYDRPIVRHPMATVPVRTWRTVGPLVPCEGRIAEAPEAAQHRVALANSAEHIAAHTGVKPGASCQTCGRASCRATLNTRRPCPFKGRVAPAAVKAPEAASTPRPMFKSGDLAPGYVDDATDRWQPRVKA